MKLYKVGGCVRDAMLGIPAKDIDYAVEAESFEDMELHIRRRGRIFQSRPQFATIRAKIDGEDADFVLCRKEGFYSDGRRPDSVSMGTIYDDLARRDFTMNAMARDENGALLDPFSGSVDLKNKIIRCVGNTRIRFEEDALRILRAMRFAITKEMALHHEIIECFRSYPLLELLSNVSEERIKDELQKCFAHDTKKTLYFLGEYPLLMQKIFEKNNLWLLPTNKER